MRRTIAVFRELPRDQLQLGVDQLARRLEERPGPATRIGAGVSDWVKWQESTLVVAEIALTSWPVLPWSTSGGLPRADGSNEDAFKTIGDHVRDATKAAQ